VLEVKNLSRVVPGFSLQEINFRVTEGEYFILLGVSGAGKSMLLEVIAGLDFPDSGQVFLEGTDITRTGIQHRGIGLVFQDLAIFPHKTVGENIAYSLHGMGLSRLQKQQRVAEVAERMNIGGLIRRRPSTLSGGELQRVALARTLVQNPRVLLLDEPLSSLDSLLRSGIRSLLRRIHREGQTIIHVTHDYEEAISLGDTVAVMHEGRIIQTGSPGEVFTHPESEFVAHFTGVRNFFRSTVVTDNGACFADPGYGLRIRIGCEARAGTSGYVMIRPEDVILSGRPFDSSVTNSFPGTVAEIIPARSGTEVLVEAGIRVHALVTQESVLRLGLREGSTAWVNFKALAVTFISD
jgi:molybdopterin-binding protein